MHHADLEFDVTTGLRFHPLEILISMLIKVGAVLLLGAPAVAVLVFTDYLPRQLARRHPEALLNLGTSLLNVPLLLLQPLAENAIQYSVAEVAGEVLLHIDVSVSANKLQITIAQDGATAQGGWPDTQQPTNLLNLAERLQLLFGDKAHLLLSQSENGFYSQISLPTEALDGSA